MVLQIACALMQFKNKQKTFRWLMPGVHMNQLKAETGHFCCWSLLCSTVLHSWADSLHLHVILHEWLAFYSTFLNTRWALTWLVPHETADVLCACLFSCKLSPALLAEWPGSFMCYCSNGGGSKKKKKSAQEVDHGEEIFFVICL